MVRGRSVPLGTRNICYPRRRMLLVMSECHEPSRVPVPQSFAIESVKMSKLDREARGCVIESRVICATYHSQRPDTITAMFQNSQAVAKDAVSVDEQEVDGITHHIQVLATSP